jgi:hypothetical protein
MAWRIDENLIRGEIDNRTRGRVTGRLWFAGRTDPVELDLVGNAWRDLAGHRLEFVNPAPQPGLPASFASRQDGTTGDITASRKVKVPDIPLDQIGEYYAARKPFPWHWGNSLYLEWFSATNGRVVIESVSYQLTISTDSTWTMTPAEEDAQRTANATGLATFLARAGEALPAAAETDPDRPLTEAEADKIQADSDRLMDRVMARLDRAGDDADLDEILEEEIKRARRERGEPDLTPEQEAERARWIDEMNAAAAELMAEAKAESWKPEREESGGGADDPFGDRHPLSAHAFELTLRVVREIKARGWLPDHAGQEHPVTVLRNSLMGASAKLAGSLDRDDWPPPLDFCASTIVRLKKAAGLLEDARLAAESCRTEALTDPAWLAEVAQELDAIAADTDALIAELRARLENER